MYSAVRGGGEPVNLDKAEAGMPRRFHRCADAPDPCKKINKGHGGAAPFVMD